MTAVLTFALAAIIVGVLTILFVRRDKTAVLIDADESARWFETVRNVPEPTWDQSADLPRARLRSVPVNGRHLAAVPNEDDDLWAGYFEERPAPFTVPVQRDGSGH